MALSQVAAVLRYSEPSAFTRAFRHWAGQTPSAWRATHSNPRKLQQLRRQERGERNVPVSASLLRRRSR
jgi:AraC-like DNA-binding protein